MTLNVIDNKMKAQTKIELQPTISYVSASSDCNFFDRLDIDSPGTSGDVNHSNIEFGNNSCVYEINATKFSTFNSQDNVLEKITSVKENINNARASVNSQWDNVDTGSYSEYDIFSFALSKAVSLEENKKKSYIDAGLQKSSDA